jgi:hypothetical protein
MILRRVIGHFRKQEWTAIALDFVIVVLGVFVGIQVSNWNAARELRASEISHATQLRDEIVTNVRLLEAHQSYTQALVEAGRRALAFLEDDGPCAEECADLIIDFFHASQLWGTPYPRARFDENVRIGFPSDEAVRAKVELFYLNLAGWNPINLTAPAFRTKVRGYLSPESSHVLWGDCFDVPDDQLERLSRDCVGDLDPADAASMLDDIRADAEIAGELRFWIGQNIFALDEFPDTLRTAKAAIAALDGKIGGNP